MEMRNLESAAKVARKMVDVLIPETFPFESGDELALLISGLGSTPVMELYILTVMRLHIWKRRG